MELQCTLIYYNSVHVGIDIILVHEKGVYSIY